MDRKAKVFLGSSSEAQQVMWVLERELKGRGLIPKPWVGAFGLSRNTLAELWRLAHEVDFAVFVWSADALVEDRGTRQWTTRDNIIYEAGLFAGVLSVTRVFLIVQSGVDVKIPSDLLGIGYAQYDATEDGIRSASADIHGAIDRAEQEMNKADVTRSIEGLWVDAVVGRSDKTVISAFELRRTSIGVLDVINGYGWAVDGEPRATFSSTSSKFEASHRTLHYSWEGTHPREPGVPQYFGVGKLQFDADQSDRASGWFSSSPRDALQNTTLVSRFCRKAPTDDRDVFSDDREIRRTAVARLLQWRNDL